MAELVAHEMEMLSDQLKDFEDKLKVTTQQLFLDLEFILLFFMFNVFKQTIWFNIPLALILISEFETCFLHTMESNSLQLIVCQMLKYFSHLIYLSQALFLNQEKFYNRFGENEVWFVFLHLLLRVYVKWLSLLNFLRQHSRKSLICDPTFLISIYSHTGIQCPQPESLLYIALGLFLSQSMIYFFSLQRDNLFNVFPICLFKCWIFFHFFFYNQHIFLFTMFFLWQYFHNPTS